MVRADFGRWLNSPQVGVCVCGSVCVRVCVTDCTFFNGPVACCLLPALKTCAASVRVEFPQVVIESHMRLICIQLSPTTIARVESRKPAWRRTTV